MTTTTHEEKLMMDGVDVTCVFTKIRVSSDPRIFYPRYHPHTSPITSK